MSEADRRAPPGGTQRVVAWILEFLCQAAAAAGDRFERGVFALHVLFVCTGNICRSPTAERLAAAYGDRFQVPNFTTSSAGTHAVIGHAMHPDAALVLERLGGDASNFGGRQLTPKIASSADLVLTMTKAHRDAVLELAPHKLRKTFTLSEAANLASGFDAENIADLADLRPQLPSAQVQDIPDPIGQDVETFEKVGYLIAELLPPILRLCRWSPDQLS